MSKKVYPFDPAQITNKLHRNPMTNTTECHTLHSLSAPAIVEEFEGENMNDKAIGIDGYNQAVTGSVTAPLRSSSSDADKVPLVLNEQPSYGIGRDAFNMGKNAKYDMSIEEEEEPTLTARGASGVAQPISKPYGFDPQAARDVGEYFLEDCGNTLNVCKHSGVAPPVLWLDTAQANAETYEECATTLTATNEQGIVTLSVPYGFDPNATRDAGDYCLENVGNTVVNGTSPGYHNGVIEPNYIVRRLTPTECCRLQGFPDWWCDNLETENPTDEDLAFWREVWDTHDDIMGAKKHKTDKQILKWLKSPHTDSAEYKMWGNGVALPCVWFILAGIKWYDEEKEKYADSNQSEN